MSDFEDFAPRKPRAPGTPGLTFTPDDTEDPTKVSPAEQARRDANRAALLRAEAVDPNAPGGQGDRDAAKRELQRMGVQPPKARDFADFSSKSVAKPAEGAGPGFWDTLTNESVWQILERGMIPNLAKGVSRKLEEKGLIGGEESAAFQAKRQEYEATLRGPVPKGKRWATYDEWLQDYDNTRKAGTVKELLTEAKDYAVKHPGATTAEFLKGILADPELLLPVFGSAAGATKLTSFVARLGKLGKVGETAVRSAATAGELTIKGGAIGGAITAAEQFKEGVYDSNELAANTAISGAMFGAIGAVRGMFTPSELQSGRISDAKAKDILDKWAEQDTKVKAAVDAGELTVADVKRKAFMELEADKVLNARAKADKLMQEGADKATVERIIKRDPLVGEEMDKIRKRREDVAASRLGTVLQGEVLDAEAKPQAPKPPGEVVDMPPVTKKLEGPQAAAVEDAGLPPKPAPKPPAGSGFRVPKGQRGAVDVTAFEDLTGPNARDSALGPLIAAAPYTLKSLERLPKNRFEFTVDMVRQELRRQDITDAERGVIEAALGRARPDGKISATELMRGVRSATGDWELQAKETSQYADYGLEGIDRLTADDLEYSPADVEGATIERHAPTGRYQILTPAGEVMDYVSVLEGQSPEEALANWKGTAVQALKGPDARTTLYRLPEHMEMSDANHFQDSRLFGWTRSFDEGGVRHVVEVQSDLAQHAKGGMTPEARAAMEQTFNQLEDVHQKLDRVITDWDNGRSTLAEIRQALEPLRTPIFEATREYGPLAAEISSETLLRRARQAFRQIGTRMDEAIAKMGDQGPADKLAPVLKNWPKRLIREELAQAAHKGERVVRFATADTVAKVEGWHDAHGPYGSGDRTQPRFQPTQQGIYDRYQRDIAKFLKQLGGKEVTDAQGHTWIEVPVGPKGPVQMFGRADHNLLATIGAAGVGAALGYYLDKGPGDTGLGGAALGALAGLGAVNARGILKAGAGAADVGLGLLSTRIRNISEPLLHRAREFERRSLQLSHQRLQTVDKFLAGLKKASNPELERAIMSNDTARIDTLMPKELKAEWQRVRQTLDEIGAELKKYDRLENLREGYFPRIVKDREGLLTALGSAAKTELQRRLKVANRQAIAEGNGPLDAAGESAVINKYLQERAGGERPGFTKQRRLNEVTEALQPFYAPNAEALHTYITSATGAIERSKFFGRDLVTRELDGRQIVDLNSSIGRVVDRELKAGKIDHAQADELASMLRARFESKASNPAIQDIKNAMNIGLLGNFISAGTQLGDLATAVYAQGLRPSLESLARLLAQRHKVSAKDFGLIDHISEEFVSTRGSAKALNTIFKLSGFSGIDLLGKNTMLNAALSRYQRLAQTPKGELQIARKYSAMFGDDYKALVDELRTRTVGEQTRALLFSELSDFQPITKLEVPQKYLEMPNGRILYMLKTFMLKQADIVRRDSYNEMRKGNVARGIGNLTKLALALGISGATTQMVKDWILGRPVDFESSDIAMNFLKTFGLSQYVLDKARQGKPIEALMGTALPPYKMMDDLIRQDPKAVSYIPLIGPIIYNRSFGGADKAAAKGEGPEAARARERLRRARERQKLEQRVGG